jgi:5-enolpyruvylshikimate-3-phosphate synthase
MQRALLVMAVTMVGGCALVQRPIDPGVAEALKGQRLAATYGKKPSFMARTPGKAATGALLGPIGSAFASSAMISAGNEIVAKNNIADPAPAMTDELVTAIEKKYHTVRVAGAASEAEMEQRRGVGGAAP